MWKGKKIKGDFEDINIKVDLKQMEVPHDVGIRRTVRKEFPLEYLL